MLEIAADAKHDGIAEARVGGLADDRRRIGLPDLKGASAKARRAQVDRQRRNP